MSNIVCFGEVLWDVFPNKRKIGGAPLNVAIRCKLFNNEVTLISAVGYDEAGEFILNYLNAHQVNTNYIWKLEDFKTGQVQVALDKKGVATYTIEYPVAWDKIHDTEDFKPIVQQADAFIFGSLVARDEVSQQTLYQLVKYAKYKVFDLNLRAPHYKKTTLLHLIHEANFIKLNDEELYEVSGFLGSKFNGLEQNLKFIAKKTNTKHICITKGAFGAVLLYNEALYYNSGYKIKVVDTVGAGDSFLGTLISNLLDDKNPQQSLDVACAVGALVAQSTGANPNLSLDAINGFMYPK